SEARPSAQGRAGGSLERAALPRQVGLTDRLGGTVTRPAPRPAHLAGLTAHLSRQGVPVGGGVPPRGMVLQLALDVGEQGTGTEAEEIGTEPAVAQLLLHQRQPVERAFGLADPARGL